MQRRPESTNPYGNSPLRAEGFSPSTPPLEFDSLLETGQDEVPSCLSDTPTKKLDNASAGSQQYACVVLDRGQSQLDRELTYGIPVDLRGIVRPGFAVLVPVGRQQLTGYVTSLTSEIDFEPESLRDIVRVIGSAPIFEARVLKLARWMSNYYHCPLADCLSCCVPAGWQISSERKYSLIATDILRTLRDLSRSPRQAEIIRLLVDSDRSLSQRDIARELGGASPGNTLKLLEEQGIISADVEVLDPVMKPRRVSAVYTTPNVELDEAGWARLDKAASKQAAALRQLIEMSKLVSTEEPIAEAQAATPMAVPTAQLARDFGFDSVIWRALEKKGLVQFTTIEQTRAAFKRLPIADTSVIHLSDEQSAAVAYIDRALQRPDLRRESEGDLRDHGSPEAGQEEVPSTILVQGVTASGKTEVYLAAIERCLALGRRALVLVPEIALTAQTVEIFQRRFQERVAILHSALGAGERFDEWRRARAGKADIVVGARSAIFAPCSNIGLIIIDEEHDHSYKQDATPRYHARDVASKRAALEGAVLVLGSATPSLESYYRATRGEYGHIKLLKRFASRPLPEVEIVDMTNEAHLGTLPVLSHRLQDELCEAVGRGEQAIIFLNRRGFATYVQCLGCGHVERCPNCDVTLTYHRGVQTLNCHHCGHEAPVISECPQCQGQMIGFTGTGTEKVENEVASLLAKRGLGEVNILRLDRDTTTRKGAHSKILGEFRQGRAQVLIGTQMVTKGLDFPNVTLVGVVSADTALNVPDFRAAERSFQLLTQVAGRAGRGDRPGKVLIQTLAVDHYAIQATVAHDYERFIQQEIVLRRDPPYPPYAYVVNIISQDEEAQTALSRIERLAVAFHRAIAENGNATELLGPVECPISRVKNKFRFHLMLRDKNRPRLHRILSVYDRLSREDSHGFTVDVDCMSIL